MTSTTRAKKRIDSGPKPAGKYPLREKRKRESREKLVEAGLELFLRKGWQSVTLEEVAAHAGLHVQTLYRHFPGKWELYRAIREHFGTLLVEAYRSRQPGEDTFGFWRRWLGDIAGLLTRFGETPYRQAIQQSYTEGLPAPLPTAYEEVLTEGLAADFDLDPGRSPLPRLVACMLLGALDSACRDWAFNGHGKPLEGYFLATVDDVSELFGDRVKTRR